MLLDGVRVGVGAPWTLRSGEPGRHAAASSGTHGRRLPAQTASDDLARHPAAPGIWLLASGPVGSIPAVCRAVAGSQTPVSPPPR
jgi:hypothetical protein